MKNQTLLSALIALSLLSSGCVTNVIPPKFGVKYTSFAAKVRMRGILLSGAKAAPVSPADVESRINAFVEAVDERVEPDVNRVLGDGARVLRLVRDKQGVSKADATSLFVAAVCMGFDDVVKTALDRGADVNGASPLDAIGRPAVLMALQYGTKCNDMSWLKDARLDVRDAFGRGVVHYAVKAGDAEALSALLAANCDATRPDGAGSTPLALAADLGYIEFVKALYPVSDPTVVGEDGMTPLLLAAARGRLDIVRFLWEKNAALLNMAATDEVGEFGVVELASRAAAQSADRKSAPLLEWVLGERKIKPTPRSVTERVAAGDVATLKTLVSHGGVLRNSVRKPDGTRVPGHLYVAVKNGDLPMVQYLVARGLDVNDSSVVDLVKEPGVDKEIAGFLRGNGLRAPSIRP